MKFTANLFAVALLSVSLGSCAIIKKAEGVNVSQQQVSVAVQSFNAVEASVTNYLKLPNCAAGQSIASGCKDPSSIQAIGNDLHAGRAARDKLWNASLANPSGVGLETLAATVVAAVAKLNADMK